jgi:tRNA threonylcarbamoyladenosine biosynthesis protein TsaB
MAYQIVGTDGVICPMMDARRENVFTGIYSNQKEFTVLQEQTHMSIHDLCKELENYGKSVYFLGDGASAYQEILKSECKVPFVIAPPFANQPRAGVVVVLAKKYYEEGKIQTAAEHLPDYLRLSQAEQQLKEKNESSNH